VVIDVWVATSVHEDLIAGWMDEAGLDRNRARIRHAPGFRRLPDLRHGENPPLPPKLPTLLRLVPHLLAASAIVCSQIVEYLIRPRPCVFLDPDAIDWRSTDDHEFWACGEVVTDLGNLLPALGGAIVRHPEFARVQQAFADRALVRLGRRRHAGRRERFWPRSV
jgi:hypothetical protein